MVNGEWLIRASANNLQISKSPNYRIVTSPHYHIIMNYPMFHVLIVDDEYPARKLLMEYVQKVPALVLEGECSNALDALVQLQSKNIDILLIDIQMPDLTGLDMVRTLKYRPQIIFTTAYSEYAIESYEIEATDYLLKPIAFPRFLQAINKALGRLSTPVSGVGKGSATDTAGTSGGAGTSGSAGAAGTAGAAGGGNTGTGLDEEREEPRLTNMTPDYLVVKADHKLYKINFPDLIYIEGQREYVTFHTLHKKITALYSLKDLEEALPSQEFVRIHKSYIISFRYLETLEGNLVTLSGVKLPIGANYRDTLLGRLESR